MKILGNIIWLIFGGLMIFLEYLIGSIVLICTIIGIPFGLQTLKMAQLAIWPFGKEIESTPMAGGCLSIIMNIIWILFGGIWIALSHFIWGLILCITIIGIPFGLQHFKLAHIGLTPFGKQIK